MAEQPLFRVHRSSLLPALEAVFEAVDKRATIPILGNVLLRPNGGELLLRGTDLAIEIETSCELLEEGTQMPVTVCGVDLWEIVRNLPENAEITFAPGNFPDQVRIQAGRSRFSLLTLPERDFPAISDKVKGETIVLEIAPLIDALMKVAYAIREDKTRIYLSGACLHPHEDDGIAVVGCDGHNLAIVRLDAGRRLEFPAIIVPLKMVKAIKKLFGDSKGRADVTISDVMIQVSCGGVTIVSKLIDGTFPGYTRIIPAQNDRIAITAVAPFKAAIQRVCVVANDLEKDTVRLQIGAGALKVTMKTSAGEDAAEDIPVDYDGEPIDIGFNGKYLTAMLGSIGTQDVAMHFGEDGSMPGLFRPTIDCDEQYIVMPRKL